MIYKQCNYSILLLLYDFEFENVEIKQNKLEFHCIYLLFETSNSLPDVLSQEYYNSLSTLKY